MTDHRTDPTLRRKLWLTHAGLWSERITRAFWPAWTVAFLALAVWSAEVVPPLWSGSLLAAMAVLFAVTAVLGLRSFDRPTPQDARDRLDATMPGRPLATLDDVQAIGAGDGASEAVWAAHKRRMAARLDGASPVAPDLRVSSRDPYALRYMALMLAALGLLFGTVARVPEAPDLGGAAGPALASGPAWEGWLEPPRHTGLPTLSLAEIDPGPVAVPEGTRVTLRLYGEVGALAVSETVSGRDLTEPSAPIQDFIVLQSGTLAIDGAQDSPLWTLTATPDAAPEIALDGPPGFEHPDLVTMPWRAADDYGIVAAQVTFALDPDATDRRHGLTVAPEPRAPLILDMALPIAGDRDAIADIFRAELTEHPLAGMPVTATLEARDAAGQAGQDVQAFILPGRAFYDTVAAALAEQRRDLFWSRENQRRVGRILRAVTWKADGLFDNPSAYLLVRMAIRRLDAGPLTEEARDEVAELLWQAAIRLEENSLDSALERLRQAQERLSEAIRQGASEEEIARLTEEMRRAMDDYTRQLAQQQGQQGQQGQQQAQGEMQEITPDMLDQMMERIEELMRQGRTAEAQELLRQLQEMMENMQVAQGQPGQGGEGQQGQGQQAMEELREQLREQQGLSDEAFRDLQEQFDPNAQAGESGQNEGESGGRGRGQEHSEQQGRQPGEQQDGEGQGGRAEGRQDGQGQGARTLAERQEQLRRGVETLRDNLPGQGTEAGEAARDALGRAERAMREAERDLEDGNLGGALDDQAQAMDALRDGMQELGRALAEDRQEGQGQQRGQAGMREGEGFERDPLGRRSGEGGQLGTDEQLLGGPDAARRARELMDEIRRRSGERERPELELDYLRRLLDRF